MANFSPLTAEVGSVVSGTATNFNGFCVLLSSLQQRYSPEANQSLQDVWPSPGLVHYVHFWQLLPPDGILPHAKFTLHPSLALSYFGSVTARYSSSGCQPNFAALNRGRHLYSVGQPSRWALVHILVLSSFLLAFSQQSEIGCLPYFEIVFLYNRADHYIFTLWLLLSSSFFFFFSRLISVVGDWMFTILPHMVWP